jgi:transcriptional regulator GlxA family with amidase domain
LLHDCSPSKAYNSLIRKRLAFILSILRIYDQAISSFVEQNFSHAIRRSYENTRYFEGSAKQHPDEEIVQAKIWLQDNCNRPIKVTEVARRFDMSVRTFNGRF